MNWELDALKILAKNSTVPGIALRDAIGEIERLNKVIDHVNIVILEDMIKEAQLQDAFQDDEGIQILSKAVMWQVIHARKG